jgi:hypothetical protein
MMPNTRHDGVRLQLAGVDVVSLREAGAVPGVVVLSASARNGPGTGLLTLNFGSLTWQSPGSSTPGLAQGVSSGPDGSIYLVEDGVDLSKFVRVQVYPAYLPDIASALISLADLYNAMGTTGPGDVAASDASAGLVTITQYTLFNATNNPVKTINLWLDNTASGFGQLTVSNDGTNYFAPTSQGDPNVLAWGSIAAGGNVSVWVKRTVPAASASNPKILDVLQWAWTAIA